LLADDLEKQKTPSVGIAKDVIVFKFAARLQKIFQYDSVSRVKTKYFPSVRSLTFSSLFHKPYRESLSV
jgi:hypothetical protein